MKLYLAVINWGRFDENQEAEWFHFVADDYKYEEVEEKALQHLVDNLDIEADEAEIDEVWINEVKDIDGYTINLVKGTK